MYKRSKDKCNNSKNKKIRRKAESQKIIGYFVSQYERGPYYRIRNNGKIEEVIK